MKNYKKIIFVLTLVAATVISCTDYKMLDYTVDKPQSILDREYLNSYDALKTYINRTTDPNFKLGAGVGISEYTGKGLPYRVINANFDEITLGYAMKHGAVVKDDGSLNLDNVNKLLTVAKDAGTSVFGHTLCWHSNQNATYLNNTIAPVIIHGDGGAGGYSFTFSNTTVRNFWECQLAYSFAGALENATPYVLSFDVKGTAEGIIRPEVQSADYSSNGFGAVGVTTSWVHHELTATTTTADRIRLIISFGEFAGTVYIDNVTLTKSGSSTGFITGGDFENGTSNGFGGWGGSASFAVSAAGEGYTPGDQTIVKTEEEKKAIIDSDLEDWIGGMVTACKDYVKAWDVVNEPMSDYPDPTQLKTGVGKTDMGADEFYWQDYLGKDYAVRAFELARKYGNATDKLFINDYGLENENQEKCNGLIAYVNYIESKGQKVDGIGTQMHVTLGETSMAGIRAMFTNLAATGKLIKVSELDMGIKVDGNMLTTSEVTEAQYQEMSNFYESIIKAYFELIPAAQRYGITQWALTDRPKSSSWRADQPIGLWTLDFSRKPAYGGFINGLGGN